jgi:hypothetical protein
MRMTGTFRRTLVLTVALGAAAAGLAAQRSASWTEPPADIFLAQHPSMFDMEEQVARRRDGGANPFVDPQGYRAFVARREQAYRTQLQRERNAIAGRGR